MIAKLIVCLEKIGIYLEDNDIDENIFEYGLDSLGFIHLICMLEEMFQVEISEHYLATKEILTLKMLQNMVKES